MKIALLLCALCQSPHVYIQDTHLNEQGKVPVSTGVIIDYDDGDYTILTCAHGRDKTHEFSVGFNDYKNQREGGKVVAFSADYDLSLIRITFLGKRCPSIKILDQGADVPIAKEAKSFGFGAKMYGECKEIQERKVNVLCVKEFQQNPYPFICTEMVTHDGDSGGALVYEDKLIGVVRGISKEEKCSCFVTHKEIHKLLSEAGVKLKR
jgi:S1-C subfamily serine protease